jgi:hypothetical protein
MIKLHLLKLEVLVEQLVAKELVPRQREHPSLVVLVLK